MHLVPCPQPRAGMPTTDQAAQDPIHPDLECLQGCGTQNIFGQPVPLPLSRQFVPNMKPKSPPSNFKPFPFVLLLSDNLIPTIGFGITSHHLMESLGLKWDQFPRGPWEPEVLLIVFQCVQ